MTLSSQVKDPAVAEPKPAGAGRKPLASRLELGFAADANGRTFLRRQYAGYPFHVCRAQYLDADLPGLATLYVQSSSGGIYEDDRLGLQLSLDEGAEAHVTTQAATVVHSMQRGRAEQTAILQCASGSYLEYLPDPQILFPGSTCRSAITVRLAEKAIALVSDSLLQHDPAGQGGAFATYLSEVVIQDAGGRALAVDRLAIDGGAIAERLPGVTGSFGAQGTLVLAGLNVPQGSVAGALRKIDLHGVAIGFSALPNSAGMLIRLLAADGAALKRGMHAVWGAVRLALKGSLPAERRK
jgi:urease accessory protein